MSAPESSGPFWVARPSPPFGGVDFQGLRAPGLAMADRLLPGITNFTRQARCYTVIAWMYVKAGSAERLRPLESAFIQGVRHHRHTGGLPTVGLVGMDSVPSADPALELLSLVPGKSIVSLMDAPFYGPSARMLGIAGEMDQKSAFTGIARKLAATVDLETSEIARIGESGMPRSLLPRLEGLCPCQAASGEERVLLEEVLFRHQRRRGDGAQSEEQSIDGPRRRTLALILDALQPATDPERLVLERLLDSALGRPGYQPPSALRDEAIGMAILALRWCLRFSIEAAWVAFGHLISEPFGRPGSRPIVDFILDQAESRGRWCPEAEIPLANVVDSLGHAPGTEMRGIDAFREAAAAGEQARAALGAATVLALIADRVRHLAELESRYSDLLEMGHPWWIPLSLVASQATPEMPVREWLTLVLDRYVIGQHLVTGARKWATGKDAFFFHPSDRGYELSKRINLMTWQPNPGPTKIPAALSLMRGIDLVTQDASEQWQTTSRGRACVRRVLENPGV